MQYLEIRNADMTANQKLKVFLCHASQDKPEVRNLYHKLLAETWIDPWLDEEKLLPGQDWNLEIEKAVEASDAVIVCLSGLSVICLADYEPGIMWIISQPITRNAAIKDYCRP